MEIVKEFRALVVDKNNSGTFAEVRTLETASLPVGNVLIGVEYSTLNYKDGLCLGSGGGLVKQYPHVPGVDFAGKILQSEDSRYSEGDSVILTGWRVGETRWGGYAQLAKVNADWLVPLPKNLSLKNSMAIGTAGLTAMWAVNALENHGLRPEKGPVLITGASGGVGSMSVSVLSALGYEIAAVTGKKETADYLRELGATEIFQREEFNETIRKPLENERWAGCIDSVGGTMLARILGQMKQDASVAAVGLVGGTSLPASVIPFLLRGINLLGIDSVKQSYENRVSGWKRIAEVLPSGEIEKMIASASLGDLPELGKSILAGKIKGRIVIDVNR